MIWEHDFVERLSDVDLGDVFNPYRDRCEVHDLDDAPRIRRENLIDVLTMWHLVDVDSIWFGRDLGYRGGRRTGLALTDEIAMGSYSRSGAGRVVRATRGLPVAERTAAVIWSVISRLEKPPVLWNAFPLHPHAPGEPFTNRAHSARERVATAWAIEALIERFNKPRLIAIGNDASKALSDLGFEHELVRHPSYGGQKEFISRMEATYSLEPETREDQRVRLL